MSVRTEIDRISAAKNVLRAKMSAAGFTIPDGAGIDDLVDILEFRTMEKTVLFSTTEAHGVTVAALSDNVSNYDFILLEGIRYSGQLDRQTLLIPSESLSQSARWNMGYSSYTANFTVWGTEVRLADTKGYFNILAVYGIKT